MVNKIDISAALQQWCEVHGFATAPFRAALIDMDGTLYDSMPRHARAWRHMTSDIGFDIPEERFFLFEGMTGKATIKTLYRENLGRDATDEEADELYAVKCRYFNEMSPAPPMPGAARMLRQLVAHGIRCVLVTGSGQRALLDRLEHDFPGVFTPELMITSADVKHGKPNPEPYLMAMQRAGVSPAESLVIENAPLGVQSGAAASAFTVAVATGPIPCATLKQAGADVVFGSMCEFADKLHLIIKQTAKL